MKVYGSINKQKRIILFITIISIRPLKDCCLAVQGITIINNNNNNNLVDNNNNNDDDVNIVLPYF